MEAELSRLDPPVLHRFSLNLMLRQKSVDTVLKKKKPSFNDRN